MSQVVYTSIQRIEDLPAAQWRNGDNDSYAATQRMAEDLTGEILLVGRLDRLGRVDLVCARDGRRDEFNYLGRTGWVNVNASHVNIATFFSAKYVGRPVAPILQPFFDCIDDPVALKSVRSLVFLDCGKNGSADDFRRSVCSIARCMDALGIETGDWRFVPMLNAVSA